MKTINFKDFMKDYREYYGETYKYFQIANKSEIQEVLYDLYDTDVFNVDYDREIIELY